MNIISCETCAVVLDKDKIIFPDTLYNDYGEVIEENFVWTGDDFVAKVACPVCGADILEDDK